MRLCDRFEIVRVLGRADCRCDGRRSGPNSRYRFAAAAASDSNDEQDDQDGQESLHDDLTFGLHARVPQTVGPVRPNTPPYCLICTPLVGADLSEAAPMTARKLSHAHDLAAERSPITLDSTPPPPTNVRSRHLIRGTRGLDKEQ